MSKEIQYDFRANLRAVWAFLRRDLKAWTHFKINFLIGIANIFSSLATYGILASLMWYSPLLEPFGRDYVSYVILGIILNSFLATSITAPYNSVMDCYWSGRLEVIMLSCMRMETFVIGVSTGQYFRTFINIILYTVFGIFVFGLKLSSSVNLGLSLIFVVLSVISCTGIGLASASMISFIDARGYQDPIRLIVEIITGIASGVYYPILILPLWMQNIACFIPQTYALDGFRRALLSSGANATIPVLPIQSLLPFPPIVTDILMLALFSFLTAPIGWYLFSSSLKAARKDGRLYRWV